MKQFIQKSIISITKNKPFLLVFRTVFSWADVNLKITFSSALNEEYTQYVWIEWLFIYTFLVILHVLPTIIVDFVWVRI